MLYGISNNFSLSDWCYPKRLVLAVMPATLARPRATFAHVFVRGVFKTRNGEMTKWRNGEMTKWRNGEMAKWRNDEMAKRRNGLIAN